MAVRAGASKPAERVDALPNITERGDPNAEVLTDLNSMAAADRVIGHREGQLGIEGYVELDDGADVDLQRRFHGHSAFGQYDRYGNGQCQNVR